MTAQHPGIHHLSPEEARVRRAHLRVTIGLVLAAAVVYLGAVLLARPDLPDGLAVHFGLDGRADQVMSTPLALTVFGAVGIGLPLLLLAISVAGQWWRGATARMTSAFVGGLTAGMVALFVHLIWSQRGLADPLSARLLPGAALWGFGTALAVGLLVAALLPRPLPQPEPLRPEPVELAPTERVGWFGRAVTSRVVGFVLALGVVMVIGTALAVQEWWLLLLAALSLLLIPMASIYRAQVDARGLTWASALGWPRGRIALEDIVEVAVVQVRPGDFGGYGYRTAPGVTGLITRAGEALSLTHRRAGKERRLVITVDDAATAASVLEGLRRRATP